MITKEPHQFIVEEYASYITCTCTCGTIYRSRDSSAYAYAFKHLDKSK